MGTDFGNRKHRRMRYTRAHKLLLLERQQILVVGTGIVYDNNQCNRHLFLKILIFHCFPFMEINTIFYHIKIV